MTYFDALTNIESIQTEKPIHRLLPACVIYEVRWHVPKLNTCNELFKKACNDLKEYANRSPQRAARIYVHIWRDWAIRNRSESCPLKTVKRSTESNCTTWENDGRRWKMKDARLVTRNSDRRFIPQILRYIAIRFWEWWKNSKQLETVVADESVSEKVG